MRLIPLTLFALLFAVPAPAEAGPVRDWLRSRRVPACECAPCPCPPSSCPACVAPLAAPACGPEGCPLPMPARIAAQDPPKAATAKADPKVVEGLGDGEILKRIVLNRVRARAVDKAVKDGVPVPGGGVRQVTRAEAEKLVKKVSDDEIQEFARLKGAPVQGLGDGTFLKWLWENKEAIIKFILSLLALFADEQ